MISSRPFLQRLKRFQRDEDGNATIEFVILFPWFIFIMMMSIEAGLASSRNAMLERSLEQTVRAIRINTASPPNYNQVKKMICDGAPIFAKCDTRLLLEMEEIDPRAPLTVNKNTQCNDDPEIIKPTRGYATVGDNTLMLLRACIMTKQFFVVNGIGLDMPRIKGGFYGIVATTVFASEPS
ncbi:TadE/TadG family type IV pilus assembly protein [Algirhabdus cladophorae]|uniref:TadE/TadG family type IV pilus assembly protein n=1 Tax=Algirhabdus cladophorae TaxID=3377108 RepID=UPI003B84728D